MKILAAIFILATVIVYPPILMLWAVLAIIKFLLK